MKAQKGQLNLINKYFSGNNNEKCIILCETGNDNGKTFNGSFLFKIPYKGVFRIDDGMLTKKVK